MAKVKATDSDVERYRSMTHRTMASIKTESFVGKKIPPDLNMHHDEDTFATQMDYSDRMTERTAAGSR